MKRATTNAGAALRQLRQEGGFSITEVAEVAGVSRAQLSRVENGNTRASMRWTALVAAAIASRIASQAAKECDQGMSA